MESVPVVDLAEANAEEVVQTVKKSLLEYGFFYVKNHGVSEELIQAQFDVASELFDLPMSVKQGMPFNGQLDIGYVSSGVQALEKTLDKQQPENEDSATTEATQPDTKEQFMMTNNKLITQKGDLSVDADDVFEGSINYSVEGVALHKEVTKEYISAVYHLNQRLNSTLFDALELDSDHRTKLGSRPFCVLKQMKYAGEPSDPSKGRFGAGAHTDWGSFTILATDQTPGLEIYLPEQEKWLPVPPKPDCFVINAGDQIACLTNGVYKSALHRVVTTSTKPRFSTAVFTYFNMDATFGPLDQFRGANNADEFVDRRTTKEYFHFKLHQSLGTGEGQKTT